MNKTISTIYRPSGRALEYGEYALNIYDGCPHGCAYCYVPNCLHKDRAGFHATCTPRPGIVEATAKRLAKGDIKGKHIFLCFTCDPFPVGVDHAPTREIIRLIHESGNYVQVLTKGALTTEDWACLVSSDIFGVTVSCGLESSLDIEPYAATVTLRLSQLMLAKNWHGMKTFVSCEPVYNPEIIYNLIENDDYIDEYKIGKLNYAAADSPHYPNIDWGEFGRECERLCKKFGRKYYIKESLRAEMGR